MVKGGDEFVKEEPKDRGSPFWGRETIKVAVVSAMWGR